MSDRRDEFGAPARGIDSASPLAPFRWPAFRALWTANLISALGSMIQSVAAAWLMIDLTPSHLMVALVQASVAIPVLLLGMFAGVIADSFDRRLVMLAANVGMAIVSGALAVMAWLEAISPWSLLLMTLLIGCGFALNGPAWQASVRRQVPPEDLPQAISLNSISFNIARSLGPGIGGILLSLSGPKLAFTINALSYAGMIVVLLRWRVRPVLPGTRRAILPAIGEALRFVSSSSPVRRVLLRGFAFGFGATAYQSLIPLVVREQVHGAEYDFGLTLGSFGVGSVFTAIWISKLRRRWGAEAIVSAAMIFSAVALAWLSLAPTVIIAMCASFVAGAGQVSALTSLNVSMQLRSPESILGRCLAIYQAVVFGGFAVGAWFWGTLSDNAGLAPALLGSSAWLGLSLVILRLYAPMPKFGEGVVKAGPAN